MMGIGKVKRILYVVSGAMVLGGTETMIMNWYRNIDRNFLQIDFVCYGDKEGGYDEEIERLGGIIYRLPSKRQHLVKSLTGVYKICKEKQYEIIHVHMDAMSFYPLLMAKIAGVRVRICHCHSTNHLYTGIVNLYLKKILTFLLPTVATDLFACSNAAGDWLYGKRSFQLVHNAVSVIDFSYTPQKEKEARRLIGLKGEKVIAHIGNMNYPKNHIFLLEIFAEILKSNKDYQLILIGDGPDRVEIEKKINELKIADKVNLLGSRDDVNKIIHAIDVLVLPSFFEGLPVVLIEAQAASIPCVVSSTVTREAKITDLIEFHNLGEGAMEWAKAVMRQSLRAKSKRDSEIRQAGYDILMVSKMLEEYYESRME